MVPAPTHPDAVGDVVLGGGRAYAITRNGAYAFDLSDPLGPVELARYTAADVWAPAPAGQHLYVGWEGPARDPEHVRVLDLSLPGQPVVAADLASEADVEALAVGGGHVYVAGGDAGLLVFDAASRAVTLEGGAFAAPAGTALTYRVAWIDRYPAADEELLCLVTGGACTLEAGDQAAATATVRWDLPAAAGDHELAVVVGNQHQWVAARERVTVE